MKHKLESRLLGEISTISDTQMISVLMTEKKRGTKEPIEKMMIMASGPITSWQIDGETMETVTDFIFGGSKITCRG